MSMDVDAQLGDASESGEHETFPTSVGDAGENQELLPTLEASLKEQFPVLKSKLILIDDSSDVEGRKCWLEVLSQSVIVHHTIGPFNCARVFVSDIGLYQLQVLFPFPRTVLSGNYSSCTKLMYMYLMIWFVYINRNY